MYLKGLEDLHDDLVTLEVLVYEVCLKYYLTSNDECMHVCYNVTEVIRSLQGLIATVTIACLFLYKIYYGPTTFLICCT